VRGLKLYGDVYVLTWRFYGAGINVSHEYPDSIFKEHNPEDGSRSATASTILRSELFHPKITV
jgi:hypothetical protein